MFITPLHIYTIEDLKRHVFNLQGCGIGDDFKQSTPAVCRFKCSPVYIFNTRKNILDKRDKNKIQLL